MGLNSAPSGERIHLGIFGRRNAGKSSIVNALTGQNLAIVSDVPGTTTDPVQKSMELLPLGPVVMIDTPGLDDEGELGALRIKKAYQTLNKSDIALLVVDGTEGFTKADFDILRRILEKNIPYVIVFNKSDLFSDDVKEKMTDPLNAVHSADPEALLPVSIGEPSDAGYTETSEAAETAVNEKPSDTLRSVWVSAADGTGIQQLKDMIASLAPKEDPDHRIVGDLIEPGDMVVLVVPVDKAAPKGRLILPQQQTIRDILDSDASAIVVKENGYKDIFASLSKKPKLVITDSQVFKQVAAETPGGIPFTSFSVLFARYKGDLWSLVDGAHALDTLEDGAKILISEGCSHHRQCGDIGTEKLPAWIRKYSGRELEFDFTSGTEFPAELGKYDLIVHCGGCMLNEKEMKYRIRCAEDAGVPMTNYGTAIAHINGILDKSLEVLRPHQEKQQKKK